MNAVTANSQTGNSSNEANASIIAEECIDTKDELCFHEQRHLAYSFLATAFQRELSSDFLALLRDEHRHSIGHLEQEQFNNKMESFFETLSKLDDTELEALRVNLTAEYSSLFLAMSAHPIPPYESVYTSEKRLLMQEAWQDVTAYFAKHNFTKSESFALPEDHLGLELEFMALLVKESIALLKDGDKDAFHNLITEQHDFFGKHISSWVPQFCDDLKSRATTTFYQGLAEMTKQIIDEEKDFFSCCNNI